MGACSSRMHIVKLSFHFLKCSSSLTFQSQVQFLVEQCMAKYMKKQEVLDYLWENNRVQREITASVWDMLVQHNANFFEMSDAILKLTDQIVKFNSLLEKQAILICTGSLPSKRMRIELQSGDSHVPICEGPRSTLQTQPENIMRHYSNSSRACCMLRSKNSSSPMRCDESPAILSTQVDHDASIPAAWTHITPSAKITTDRALDELTGTADQSENFPHLAQFAPTPSEAYDLISDEYPSNLIFHGDISTQEVQAGTDAFSLAQRTGNLTSMEASTRYFKDSAFSIGAASGRKENLDSMARLDNLNVGRSGSGYLSWADFEYESGPFIQQPDDPPSLHVIEKFPHVAQFVPTPTAAYFLTSNEDTSNLIFHGDLSTQQILDNTDALASAQGIGNWASMDASAPCNLKNSAFTIGAASGSKENSSSTPCQERISQMRTDQLHRV